MALAAARSAVPVKWIEDRLEHLAAASASATGRVTQLEGAFDDDGKLIGLRLEADSRMSAPICARPSRRRSTACTRR